MADYKCIRRSGVHFEQALSLCGQIYHVLYGYTPDRDFLLIYDLKYVCLLTKDSSVEENADKMIGNGLDADIAASLARYISEFKKEGFRR